jgi:sigma-B regulation protein RsbU (phosphoserine phosphatase)
VFATVFFAILDRRTGHIVYANAGHTTAAVMKDDGTYVRLKATGPLIGAFPAMEYADYEACLGLDELLFLYTDGLTEARRNGELYGEERLFVLLATTERRTSSEVVGALLADVTTFAGNRLKDDLAILAIRRSQLEGRC